MNRTSNSNRVVVLPAVPEPALDEPLAREPASVNARRAELAQEMAHELRGAAGYAEDFGRGAPPADVVADSLDCAVAWTSERRKAEAWAEHAREQEAHCWRRARRILDGARAPFERARGRDATIEARYPNMAKMLDAEEQVELETTPMSRGGAMAMMPTAAPLEDDGATEPLPLLRVKDEARMRRLKDELSRSYRGLAVHLDLGLLARD